MKELQVQNTEDFNDLVPGPIRTRSVDARPVVASVLPRRPKSFFAQDRRARLEGTLPAADPGHSRRLDRPDLDSGGVAADADYPAGNVSR